MRTDRSKNALILDFGGVISKTPFETHRESEKALGLAPQTLTWRGPFDPNSDPLWKSMQRDEITERKYWLERTREVGAMIGKNWTNMSDFLIASRGDAPAEIIRPEFFSIIETAKAAGCKLAILSNELDLFYGPDFRAKLDFLSKFDVIHDATCTKTLKPDAQSYEGILKDLDLRADECVFVDDQKRNIVGADKIGLNTVHFDVMNPAKSYAKAASLLGLN